MARCLLRRSQSRIVLLDESTASVDAHSDFIVQKAIKEEFQQATIFVIAHRLHTIIESDLIAVMQKGSLVEFGAPTELLNIKNGVFKSMWDHENSSKGD